MIKNIGLFADITPDMVVINQILPKELTMQAFKTVNKNKLKGTILDPRLETSMGIIPVPRYTRLYMKDRLEAAGIKVWNKDETEILVNKAMNEGLHIPSLFPLAERNQGIRVPMGINRAFERENGILVVDDLQRAFDIFISTLMFASGHQNIEKRIQISFNRLVAAVEENIFYKRGLIDNICSARMPFSARAVIVGDPNMNVDQVGVPESILRNWLRKPEFQASFQATKTDDMKGKWCAVGRQPSHDFTNIMGFRIVPVRGSALHINPAVVHMFDGDFDGDTSYICMFLTPEAQEDLTKISVTAPHNLKEFRFKKEFAEFAPAEIPTNPFKFNECVSRVIRATVTGRSINWHDLVQDDMSKATGYLHRVNQQELQAYALGMSKDNFMGLTETAGRQFSDAIISYRTLKGGTAKMGGLSNSLKQLATIFDWGNTDTSMLRAFGEVKHILCQGQLAAKHGDARTGDDVCKILQAMFYRQEESPFKTLEQYNAFMVEIGIPEELANIVNTVFFSVRPNESINKTLTELNPLFMMTRRSAGVHMLDNMVGRTPTGFHDAFLLADTDLL